MKILRLMRQRQQGYNLIEMAIALVVLGLLLGGALVPLQTRYLQAQVNSAKTQLTDAKSAVLAYALRHKTVTRIFRAAHDSVTYNIPAGRPYLPCPDTDADGLENRTAITVAAGLRTPTLVMGVCEEQKGLLPWKTLGLKNLDPWGNHLTYRVDMAYSNQVLGFDELTDADVVDRQVALTTNAGSTEFIYQPRGNAGNGGGLVCDTFYDVSGAAGDCPNEGMTNLLGGIVSTATLKLGAREIPAYAPATRKGGIVEGVVFVILSHGRNGWGAINRDGKCRNAPVPFKLNGRGDFAIGEQANAFYRTNHAFYQPAYRPLNEDPNCAPITPAPMDVPALTENLFVSAPIATPGQGNDDVVVWGGASELIGFLLRGGALPIEHAEFLPE